MEIKAYRNLSQILTLEKAHQKDGRHLITEDLSIIENGSVVFSEEEILWVGIDEDFPKQYENVSYTYLPEKILIPEIVDSHTHLVFAGDRSHEYSLRLSGVSYEEIARKGGGILSTMRETQKLPRTELFKLAVKRIEMVNSLGVGTVEIKSGYGLSFEKEYELSHIIHDLKDYFKDRVQIHNTFMAAHAVPPTFSSSLEYMQEIVIPLLQKMGPEGILDSVDIFFEQNYFDKKDVILLFEEAKKLKIPCKIHADEFLNLHAANLAVEYGALSADHLLQTDDDGIRVLANSSTVATLLPGTGFFLGKKQADARKFLDAGVKVAFASDYNPGSCHCDNILLLASMAAPQYRVNLGEFWAAITLNAAHSLGLRQQGAILKGLKPRFSLFNASTHDKIPYHWGKNFSLRVY